MGRGSILYKSIDNRVEDVLEYVEKLEDERNEALDKVREWNKDAEIKKAEDTRKAALGQLSKGFAPNEEQWRKINEWEEKHILRRHTPRKSEELTKYNSNAPFFEYSFVNAPLGKLGSVRCATCYRKAVSKCFGNLKTLDRICKKKGIEFFIGEV